MVKKDLKPLQVVYLKAMYEKDSPEGWRVVRIPTGTGILADLVVSDDVILLEDDICKKEIEPVEKKVRTKRKRKKKEE